MAEPEAGTVGENVGLVSGIPRGVEDGVGPFGGGIRVGMGLEASRFVNSEPTVCTVTDVDTGIPGKRHEEGGEKKGGKVTGLYRLPLRDSLIHVIVN